MNFNIFNYREVNSKTVRLRSLNYTLTSFLASLALPQKVCPWVFRDKKVHINLSIYYNNNIYCIKKYQERKQPHLKFEQAGGQRSDNISDPFSISMY